MQYLGAISKTTEQSLFISKADHSISQQEYWSGLPFPSAGDLSDPGIKPGPPKSPALDTLLWCHLGSLPKVKQLIYKESNRGFAGICNNSLYTIPLFFLSVSLSSITILL